jgi:two-component system sensor histidine kinase GlrK
MKAALNLSILSRLISSYLLIIIIVLLSGIYTIWTLSELNKTIRSITTKDARMIRLSEECLEILDKENAAEEKFFVSRDAEYSRQFTNFQSDFNSQLADLETHVDPARRQNFLEPIKALHAQYGTLFDDVVGRMSTRKLADSEMTDYRAERDRITSEAGLKLRELIQALSYARYEKIVNLEESSTLTINVIQLSLIAAFVMVMIISVINTQAVNTPILRLLEKTKAVAKGDFGDPLEIKSPPEIRELAEAFNTMCDRLKELDQMKIDYIGYLSHELRTPLTALKEASSMLHEGVFAAVPEKQKELHSLLQEECERLIRSVNRLLDFSMMESGMMTLSLQTAPLEPIVEKNLLRFSPVSERKNITLESQIQPSLPRLRMDTERIDVALENLLSNALKFTADGGHIRVAVRYLADEKNVEVAVSDTGRGIPASGLKEVFEKFKRVDDGKGAVRGTGLGLAIVKHIINAHGGHVWAESKVGKGSTFIFSLPVPSG